MMVSLMRLLFLDISSLMMNVIIHQMQFQMFNFQMLYLLAILFLSLKKIIDFIMHTNHSLA